MSDDTKKPSAPQPKKKRRRSWRLRFLWAGTIVLLLGVILRILLPLSLPMVLRKVAGIYGMTCDYDRLQLNLFNGDAAMWGLQFKPKEGGAPILSTDYCNGNVSVLNLLRGRLVARRVEADGVEVNIDRNADGHIPLLDRIVAAKSSGKTAPVSLAPANPPASAKPGEIDLTAPFRVDALRLTHIRVHLHDRAIKPEIDSDLAMDLRLSDLGSPDLPARFEMNLSVDPMLESMQITGQGRSSGKNLDADLHVLVSGIRLKPAAAYLAPLGIRPIADSITLRADGNIHTAAAPNDVDGFTGSIAFDNLSASVDRQEAMALDHLRIDVDAIDPKSVHVARIDLDGARATGARGADGNLQVLGVELDPAPAAKSAPATQPNAALSLPQPPSVPASPSPLLAELTQLPWSVGELALHKGRVDLYDRTLSPPLNLSVVADELSANSIVHDPKDPGTKVALAGVIHLPGLIKEIQWTGSASPFADKKTLEGTLTATGIKPDALKPYLDQMGLESTLKDARFTAAASASVVVGDHVTMNANLKEFDFHDDAPLLALNGVDVSNAQFDPRTGKIAIDAIELSGPRISVLRDRGGQWSALGLRTKPSAPVLQPKNIAIVTAMREEPTSDEVTPVEAAPVDAAPATQPAGPSITLPALPRISLKRFRWNDIAVNFEDQATTPAARLALPKISLAAENISTDPDQNWKGHFRGESVWPANHASLAAEGDVVPLHNGLRLGLKVSGSRLDATSLAPYLKPFGVEPVLRSGSLSLTASAVLNDATKVGPLMSVHMDALQYDDGSRQLASVDHASIDGIYLYRGLLGVRDITIQHPHAIVQREGDQSLLAAGFRLLPQPIQEPDSAVVAPSAMPDPPPAATAPSATAPQATAPLAVYLPSMTITDAGLDWTDHAVQPAVTTSAAVSVGIQGLMIGRNFKPAKVSIGGRLAGAVDQFAVSGEVNASPRGQSAVLDVVADGIRAGPLSAYLSPGTGCSLKNGKFSTRVTVTHSKNPAGGFAAGLVAGPLDFRDAGDKMPLLHLDSVTVDVPRIDLPDTAVTVREISVTGLQARAERLPGHKLACLGLIMGEQSTAPATQPAAPARPTTPPATARALPPTTGPSVEEMLASAHRPMPRVTVDKLDLNVADLTLTDLSRPQSQPLVISDLRLHNVNRIDWLGKDAFAKPPTHLQLQCKIAPLVDRVLVDIMASPFARQPNLQVDFSATGVHGNGLTELAPEYQSELDGSPMDNGVMTAHLESELKFDRRTPLDFDLSHGFDLAFLLSKFKHRASPGGPVLLGVDEVRADSIRIDPGQSLVHVKTLEITKPAGLLTRDSKGIEALGWVYRSPTKQAGATQPTATARSAPAGQKKSTAMASSAKPATAPKGEVRIDKLLISGLDFRAEDNSVNPPLVVPLSGLDVEVRNISSLAQYEDKPMRFSAIVNAGKVKLAKNGSSPVVFEQRDLFSQVAANGEVSLYPELHGWAKTSVSEFDLAALQGEAKLSGADLRQGLYDMSVDLLFEPSGAVKVNSRFVLTDLSLSEPPNGPIARTLHLAAPLDVAIGAMEAPDQSITLPINLTVDPEHVSAMAVTNAVVGAVAQVMATAVASIPMKSVNAAGGLLGLGGSKKSPEAAIIISYPPGSSAMGADQSAELAPLLQKLRHDPSLTVTLNQQLGAGDMIICGIRANPSKEECDSIETALRTRKAQLLQLRSDAAGRARARLVSAGPQEADESIQHLRAIDRELAATEESLDQVGDLLRTGAEKQADRRTRAAALHVATDRLADLKTALQAAGIAADRINAAAAQFNPDDNLNGGRIAISVVVKK